MVAEESELLTKRWPRLAAELSSALGAAGENDLAAQIPALRVVKKCDCGDDFCQSFSTWPFSEDMYGPGHRNLDLEVSWPGYLILDVVVDDRIAFVEVLYRAPLD